MGKVRAIPEGMHTITPHLTVKGAANAIDYYKRAFGATVLSQHAGPNGLIMHSALRIGDSTFFLNDEFPGMSGCASPKTYGGTSVVLTLYVEDVDAVFNRAVAAGAEVKMPLTDQFWGDRYGTVADPLGHWWAIATHKEDVSPEELERRGQEAMAQMGRK